MGGAAGAVNQRQPSRAGKKPQPNANATQVSTGGSVLEVSVHPVPRSLSHIVSCDDAQWWSTCRACTRPLGSEPCSARHNHVGWCWYHVVVTGGTQVWYSGNEADSCPAGLLADSPLLAAHATGTGAKEKSTTSGGK